MTHMIEETVAADLEAAADHIRKACRLFAPHVGQMTEAFVAQIAEDTVSEIKKENAALRALAVQPTVYTVQ